MGEEETIFGPLLLSSGGLHVLTGPSTHPCGPPHATTAINRSGASVEPVGSSSHPLLAPLALLSAEAGHLVAQRGDKYAIKASPDEASGGRRRQGRGAGALGARPGDTPLVQGWEACVTVFLVPFFFFFPVFHLPRGCVLIMEKSEAELDFCV